MFITAVGNLLLEAMIEDDTERQVISEVFFEDEPVGDVARAVGQHRRTCYRWLDQFRARFDQLIQAGERRGIDIPKVFTCSEAAHELLTGMPLEACE